MKGNYPVNYFQNPNMDKEKTIEQIWDDIDSFTGEFFADAANRIEFYVAIPPFRYKGKFTKGVFYSQGMDYILDLYPDLKKIFFTVAYTMWSNYSWCDRADCYFTCYENKPREEYHKKKYPKKKDIIFIPLQDADWTDEYYMAPIRSIPKTIDVFIVSTPIAVKNYPMIAKMLLAYERMFNYRLKVKIAMGDKNFIRKEDGTLDMSNVTDQRSVNIMNEVNAILNNKMYEYIDFYPYIEHYTELPKCYTSAKCTLLASLIEGKNRCIFQSMSCDTPVVVFKDHNKWARGNHPVFWEGCGEYASEFTPESLAIAVNTVINNPSKYEPRKNFFLHSGRKNFINTIARYIPYYRENIPGYVENRFTENLWVDLACWDNYGMSYHDFMYKKRKNVNFYDTVGPEGIRLFSEWFLKTYNI